VRRRIHACQELMSCEEEDTCMSRVDVM